MMRRILLLVPFLAIFLTSQAQLQHGVGVHFGGFDFLGPQEGTYLFNKSEVKVAGQKKKLLFWDPAVKVSYWNHVYKFIDASFSLQLGNLQYPNSDNDTSFVSTKMFGTGLKKEFPIATLDAKAILNILNKEKYVLAPYGLVGLNTAFRSGATSLSLPLGLGCNVRLTPNVFLNLESEYHLPMGNKSQTYLFHSVGVAYWWGGKKVKEKPIKIETPKIVDTDNDGTPDSQDDCPTIAGRKETKGCPDQDNDGIVDKMDDCPTIAGKPQFRGCPDSDGDGIRDIDDKCPSVAGVANYQGCPIPDTDHDGFNDEVDRCKTEFSTTNGGCPEVAEEVKEKVKQAAKGVYFESGKSAIKTASFVNLNKVVEIMNSDPSLKIDIEGHTDNVGNAEKNMFLSQQRADACKNYLKSKGISESRITSTGFGDMNPIADNTTKEGRALNRRTEFILSK